jgi:hypothetical protein
MKDGKEQTQSLAGAQETFVTSLEVGFCCQQQRHHDRAMFLVASIYLTSLRLNFPSSRAIHFVAVFTCKQLDSCVAVK